MFSIADSGPGAEPPDWQPQSEPRAISRARERARGIEPGLLGHKKEARRLAAGPAGSVVGWGSSGSGRGWGGRRGGRSDRSVGVGADGLAAGAGADLSPDVQGDGVLDEPDRAVGEGDVDAAGVVAAGRGVALVEVRVV